MGAIEVCLTVAGVIQVAPAESVTFEDFDQAISTMLYGPINIAWQVLPAMRERGHVIYGLKDKSGKIVYVGQTELRRWEDGSRMSEHMETGRFDPDSGMEKVEITRVRTNGEMRGAENYHIKANGTLDMKQRGESLKGNPANRALSIAEGRKGPRGMKLRRYEALEASRARRRNRIPRTTGPC